MQKTIEQKLEKYVFVTTHYGYRCPQWYSEYPDTRSIIYHHIIFSFPFAEAIIKYLWREKRELLQSEFDFRSDSLDVPYLRNELLKRTVTSENPIDYLERFF